MMHPLQKQRHTDEEWKMEINNKANNSMKFYHYIIINLPNLTKVRIGWAFYVASENKPPINQINQPSDGGTIVQATQRFSVLY